MLNVLEWSFIMLKKIAVVFAAAVLLSGCSSSTNKSAGSISDHDRQIEEFGRTVGEKVLFAYNSSTLSADAQKTLANQAKWLGEYKSFNATVEGHCDERGTREYNIALGERRGNAIKAFFAKHGVPSDRINVISYGKERPAVMGNDEAAWKQNRRGVTVLK